MEKKKIKFMDLNRETAMRLWNKTFGKTVNAIDFAGRKINKGAYNDRNSEFGWNVDHILPQSRGGKTADYNLVCCHISTNDEKADKFPCFSANGIKFEIIKVENHYELKKIEKEEKKKAEESTDEINFFDSASGIKFFKKLKGIQNKSRFVGSVLVRIKGVKNTAVVDFIEKFFDLENISYSLSENHYKDETKIIAKNYNMPLKEDSGVLLDKCILLNTYFQNYFEPMKYIDEYEIIFRLDCFNEKKEMYLKSQNIDFKEVNGTRYENTLLINNLVIINTEANGKVKQDQYNRYVKYNYVFTNVSKNLKKEVSRN